MVRLPRQRGYMTQEEMNKLLDEIMFPDWLDRLMFFNPPQKNLMRLAVRVALLHWN